MTHEEKMEGKLVGINHHLAAIEDRLMRLQTLGGWLFAGLVVADGAILLIASRIH